MTSSAREFAARVRRLATDEMFAPEELQEEIESRDAEIAREASKARQSLNDVACSAGELAVLLVGHPLGVQAKLIESRDADLVREAKKIGEESREAVIQSALANWGKPEADAAWKHCDDRTKPMIEQIVREASQ